ncbi:ABC-2 type transport system ATP-binding protein [Bacillus mesophilus]|uniref:ABC transporter ATP-binding protein n=1 Tax=Bacillus mesophilus TaxID=1808955 RepID=A0A6M0Q3I9_9BACI|nr:ABC transporter ATP-binding protein [Bacillus mesophilus]MBM7660212.1 ABC-2 type transport system ATP-binding protein [Bacillus mesophilus]NEY70931.1 ABC transporter ATP-binding protein [Bacillus mesophilus]
MSVIKCKEVTKIYGRAKAIHNLSFTIEENKITGLIGRNGAGKSTLLKMIAGLIKKSDGEISVFSEQPFNSLKVSSNLIFIDENMIFPNSLSLIEIIKAAGTFYSNWDKELAHGLLTYFSFKGNERYEHLSKGKKGTFNMIVGLSARCPITIFDEPTNGMDASVRKDFYRALLKDYLAFPRTIILSSHLLAEMEHILEDILLIKDGQKCLHMPVLDMKEFAIGLSGQPELVEEWIKGLKVLHKKNIGSNQVYVVVEDQFNKDEKDQVKSKGIELSSVSTEELCVFLTDKMTGGIDDVFNRN